MTLLLLTMLMQISASPVQTQISSDATLSYTPNVGPDLLDKVRTANFIRSTQNTDVYNSTNIDQIYFKLGSIKILDPTLSTVSQSKIDLWTNQILSFENIDGGFGQWKNDVSSLSSTKKAIEALSWMNTLANINSTHTAEYLNSLRNQLTTGFNSNKYDSDSDIYASSIGVEAYDILGLAPANQTDLLNHFLRAQNNGSSSYTDPQIDGLGGFGKQTNNVKLVFWSSEVTITRAALFAINSLGGVAENTLALNFLLAMQTSSGAFVNNALLTTESITYTASALEAINLLGGTPDTALAQSYILGLEDSNGLFKLKSSSASSSIKGTFYALRALNALGSNPTDTVLTLNTLNNYVPTSNGYGAAPGEEASLRTTFDAVAALVYMGRTPTLKQRIVDYVETYRNLDGGFGVSGSYTESTLRAVEIYNLLGMTFPDSAKTISFLLSLQQADGGFSKGNGKTVSYTISTYRAIRALSLLGGLPSDKTSIVNYIQSTKDTTNGGYGGYFSDISDVSSTYRAIRTLSILGDSSYDAASVINYIKSSQIADGGFKRSPYDVLRPNNNSNAVFTYSALRTLQILGSQPDNVTSLYTFINSLRNRDGGYAEHPQFTSNVAYTFTNLWILKNINSFINFKVEITNDLGKFDITNKVLSLKVDGAIGPFTYNVSLNNNVVSTGVMSSAGTLDVNLDALTLGSNSIQLLFIDGTGQIIEASADLSAVELTSSIPSEQVSSAVSQIAESGPTFITSLLLLSLAISIQVVFLRRKN